MNTKCNPPLYTDLFKVARGCDPVFSGQSAAFNSWNNRNFAKSYIAFVAECFFVMQAVLNKDDEDIEYLSRNF